jgi:Asp-tRNA(Asn)/Glu-tRNA(Gln) amidotransferase A subunit family amidase
MATLLGNLPRLFPQPDQTIAGIGRAIREGRLTCVDVLRACLDQVEAWEPKVHAWVVLDRDGALEQARALDEELKAGKDRGPLQGIPIGIKDIIDVKGLPTACGAKRWADRIADADAEVVERLRHAGAVILGKTVTTPYAWVDPPVTRNPWNLDRTPGGSSSGSAAAVACGMCYGAIGTQTGGSITRPASFCGVAGMKPNKVVVMLTMSGIQPFASSLDHVGPIARAVEDLKLVFEVMCEPRDQSLESQDSPPREGPVKLGRLRGFFDRRATPAVLSALNDAARTLNDAGADIVELVDPVDFEQILRDHRTVMAAEAARAHSEWLDQFPDDYPPRIRDLILEGRSLLAIDYLQAQSRMQTSMKALLKAFNQAERRFWITPATLSTAPDPSTTGDPAFNSPWSYTGLPTVSFPIALAPDGLPVAVQISGWLLLDQTLLRAAAWCEHVIRTWQQSIKDRNHGR